MKLEINELLHLSDIEAIKNLLNERLDTDLKIHFKSDEDGLVVYLKAD